MNTTFIVLFVVFDLIVTAAVIGVVLRRRTLAAGGSGLDLRKVTELSREIERRTEEYLGANWSGDPATLPVAISSLLSQIESDVQARQVPIDRAQLRVIVGRLIEAKGLAKGHDVREAMQQVA